MDIKLKLKKDYDRTLSLGISEATWRFVDVGGQSCEHRDLNGIRFNLRKGAPFNGGWVKPLGQCRCGYSPIIPGFDEPSRPVTPKKGMLAAFISLLRGKG